MLPSDSTAWPPASETKRYSRIAINSTWYGGDPQALSALYGGNVPTAGPSQKNLVSRVYDWLWGQSDPTQLDDKVHVPVAQDIAQMSADLLFAESPRFVVQPVLFDANGKVPPEHEAEVKRTQRRLDDILTGCNMDALLLAGAETAAALGSAGFRIGWDTTTMTMPVITRVDGDAIVPEFAFGQLSAVTFWRMPKIDGETVYFHLERHEPGRVLHGLYKGVRGNLGKRVPFVELTETAYLDELTNDEGEIVVIPKRMDAVAIPNMLPDPLDRLNGSGRSDYSPGVLTIFDSIDKAMTSLMRDIEDGRSRLLIADYMLDAKGPGQGVEFDANQRLFTRLKRQPGEQGDPPIDQVQFTIRVDEHLRTLDYLIAQAVKLCGYNTDAEIGENAAAMTATEYSGRAKRSMATRAKKLRYWQALEPLMETLLHVDAEFFGSGVVPLPVQMDVPPATQASARSLAETIEIVERAKAASLEVKVKMLHPDWDDDAVREEVAALRAEQSLASPDMLPGNPGQPGAPLEPITVGSSV